MEGREIVITKWVMRKYIPKKKGGGGGGKTPFQGREFSLL